MDNTTQDLRTAQRTDGGPAVEKRKLVPLEATSLARHVAIVNGTQELGRDMLGLGVRLWGITLGEECTPRSRESTALPEVDRGGGGDDAVRWSPMPVFH